MDLSVYQLRTLLHKKLDMMAEAVRLEVGEIRLDNILRFFPKPAGVLGPPCEIRLSRPMKNGDRTRDEYDFVFCL